MSHSQTLSEFIPQKSQTARTLIPGIAVGMMFVIASVAITSEVEHKALLLKVNEDSKTNVGALGEFHAIVRSRQHIDDFENKSPPVHFAYPAISDGLKLLSDPERLIPSEQVTLEVSGRSSISAEASAQTTRKALVRILARSASRLNLRMTFRAAPSMLFEVAELLDEIQKDEALRVDQIALSADQDISPDALFVDLICYPQASVARGSFP